MNKTSIVSWLEIEIDLASLSWLLKSVKTFWFYMHLLKFTLSASVYMYKNVPTILIYVRCLQIFTPGLHSLLFCCHATLVIKGAELKGSKLGARSIQCHIIIAYHFRVRLNPAPNLHVPDHLHILYPVHYLIIRKINT